jgi:hypothetical protein
MVIVAALAVMPTGATALATDDAFADKEKHDDKKDGKEPSSITVNDCGSVKLPLNIFCQNIASQVQGVEYAVALFGDQRLGEDEVNGAIEEAQ